MTTNKYLIKASASKENHEIRDTAVIGGVGTASSLVTNHIQDRLGLNGTKPSSAPKKTTLMDKVKSMGKKVPIKEPSLADKAKSFVKNPGKALSSLAKNPSFKRNAKIGAIGGAIGLVGDYAAVKLNKKLEKVAEMYYVKGHPGDPYGNFKTPHLGLTRPEYHEYEHNVESHPSQHLPLAAGALGAGAAAAFAHSRGGKPLAAAAIGSLPGLFLGRYIADKMSHNSALEKMKMVNPMLLDEE
jgi:hypothetical protein